MLYNYFKISLRNIRKHPTFSLINILGLALGISIFIFIDQFLEFEYSYDQFHKDSKSIYRVGTHRYLRSELIGSSAGAMPPLKALIKENIPEVAEVVRIYHDGLFVVENPNSRGKTVYEEEKAYYGDPDFFNVFGFKLLAGNPESALDEILKVAISESTAMRYFGSTDVIGETLKATNQREVIYRVSAVYTNPPVNSHFKPDMVFSFLTYLDVVHPDWSVRTNWIWNDFRTYLRFQNAKPALVERRINDLAQQTWGEKYLEREVNFEFFLQPIEEIHHTSNLLQEFEKNIDADILSWLKIISIMILMIAWINYINLSTARSLERAKEVGVRKTVGASRMHLGLQFLTEAMMVNCLALIVAVMIIVLGHRSVTNWLELDYIFNLSFGLITPISMVAIGGVCSALYPAFILSGFRPTVVLKGKFRNSQSGLIVRKSLVYLQFIITPLLVGGTYLIYTQTNHLINRDIGVSIDEVVVIKAPKVEYANLNARYDLFVNQAQASLSIKKVSSMMMLPGDDIGWYSWFHLIGDTTSASYMNINLVEYGFEEVVDLQLVAGRGFNHSYVDSTHLIINEAAAAMWGYSPDEIIGKTFRWSYSPTIPHFDKTVVGVVSNHIQEAYESEEVPVIYSLRRYTPARFSPDHYLVKLSASGDGASNTIQSELSRLGTLWAEQFPNDPFNYTFLDDSFQLKFVNEMLFSKVVNAFAVLSLIIAGMGLFGLASFSILQRTKEIGIRKVLGASALRISKMILSEYILLIGIAYLISLPLLYYASNSWLENYTLRIELGVVFFTLPLIVSLFIGLLSVFFQTTKATTQNPVKSLRYE